MKNKLLSILICVSLLFSLLPKIALPASAETYSGTCGAEGDNLTWSLDTETGLLKIEGSGAMRNYINDNRAPWYSYHVKIRWSVLPDGLTSIGDYAFYWCNNLTSITIPDSVTSIGDYAFWNCSGLTSVTIPDGVTSISDHAFSGCSGLTSITIPGGVTSIGDYAFSGCRGLTSITIPDSVTSIGDYAFSGCSGLTSITIPDGVTHIGDHAFSDCSELTSITVADANENYCNDDCGVLFSKDRTKLICCPGGYTGEYTVPDGVAVIGGSAFWNCTGLTSVTIPDGVTSIGYTAFWNCTGLTNATIQDSVTSIGDYAFCLCSSLTSVTIPDGVTHIGGSAFECRTGLTGIGDYAFYECGSLTSVMIPDGMTSIGDYAFQYCSSLTSITIPDGVTSIGEGAFSGCTGLTSVTIPDGVTNIGNYAFYNCSASTSVTIPASVTFIGERAFGYVEWGKVNGFTIYGCVGSAAEAYANENGFLFQVSSGTPGPAVDQHVVKSDPNEDRDFTFNMGEEIEDLVFSTASTEYNPRLAHFLSVMARSAYVEDQVRSNYIELGFTDPVEGRYHYNDDGYAGLLIGERLLDDGSRIVMITIRGSSSFLEWMTDLSITLIDNNLEPTVGMHEGFYVCEEELYHCIEDYFGGEVPTRNVTYVITGHSLGAAMGNLLSLKLYKKGVPNWNLYNYNYACPLVGAGSGDHGVWNYNGFHSNIINICNQSDVVPLIPNEGNYEIYTRLSYWLKGWSDFRRFGVSYWFDNGWANWFDAHNMCAYIDYLAKELDESHFISKEYYYNTISVHGPVDVVVFDKNGNPIASVSGNEPNYYGYEEGEKMNIFTDGDSKEIWVLNDDQIDVHLSATGEGEMEYSCFRRELTSGNTSGKKYYESVNLTEGKRMASTFGGEITADEAKLIVLDEDDNAVAEILEDGTEIVLQSGSDCYLNPFTDVKEGKYFFIPVLWACYHDPQITSGTSDTTFSPNDTCTRAQIVTFLWRAAGSPEPKTTNNPFIDVKPGKYYYKPVLWAVEQGITSGTTKTTFGPNNGCTRGQVVTFLWRYAGSPKPEAENNPFTDVKSGKYYYKPVLWALENGITSGISPRTFGTDNVCNRAQIVTFLYRYLVG